MKTQLYKSVDTHVAGRVINPDIVYNIIVKLDT